MNHIKLNVNANCAVSITPRRFAARLSADAARKDAA